MTFKKVTIIVSLIGLLSIFLSACDSSPNKIESTVQNTYVVPTKSLETALVNKIAVITNTYENVFENPDQNSKIVTAIKKGNLVRILKENSSDWTYVDCFSLSYPRFKGYVKTTRYSFDFVKNKPNQGLITNKPIYAKPDKKSLISSNNNLLIEIVKRENSFAYCTPQGGAENIWIKENDIEYVIPNDK